jgi:hypothetical protein
VGTPPDALLRLVDRYSQDRKVFLSRDYKEEQLSKAKTPHEQESFQRQIATEGRSIGALAYERYGPTEEDRRIIEEERSHELPWRFSHLSAVVYGEPIDG